MATLINVFTIFLILLLLVLGVEAQSQCTRYSETGIGFSICPPEGWIRSDESGQKFKQFDAPPPNVRNLNFKEEESKLPLADYATKAIDYALEQIKELGFDNITLISRTEFETASKAKGIHVIFSGSYKGYGMRTNQFIFDGRDSKKIILTFTGLDTYKEANDKVFEAVATTFQIEN